MKSIWKIILICLLYNIFCYGMIVLYDAVDENLLKIDSSWQFIAGIGLFIVVPLSVIIAEVRGFSQNFTWKQRLGYALLWAVISLAIMFSFGYGAANGHFIKQREGKMLNGMEYFIPGLLLGAAIPLLYLLSSLRATAHSWLRGRG